MIMLKTCLSEVSLIDFFFSSSQKFFKILMFFLSLRHDILIKNKCSNFIYELFKGLLLFITNSKPQTPKIKKKS
jgi:hypothetical protein